jgi:hypothetical protein
LGLSDRFNAIQAIATQPKATLGERMPGWVVGCYRRELQGALETAAFESPANVEDGGENIWCRGRRNAYFGDHNTHDRERESGLKERECCVSVVSAA